MAAADKTPERHSGRSDSGKLVAVMNGPLMGVPAAYAVSNSVTIALITAIVTVVTAVAYLICHGR